MLHAAALSRLAVRRQCQALLHLHPSRCQLRSVATPSSSASSASSRSPGVFRSAWKRYTELLETRPIATKVVTACGIAALGDIGCQLAIEKSKSLDIRRAGTFTLLGGVVVAPMLHYWYGFMNATLPGIHPKTVAKRLVLDQFAFTPFFMPIFFGILMAMEGRSEDWPDKIRQDLVPTLKANWMVWFPAQAINFTLVPAPLQVLFANTVSVGWNAYLSFVTHRNAVVAGESESESEREQDAKLLQQRQADAIETA